LIGKINFIKRFISNLSGKIHAFSSLLKLNADQEFVWGKEQQLGINEIKNYLANPPVLVPPQHGKPFRLYLSTSDMVIGSALIQEDWLMLRQDIRQLRNYAYAYTFLVSN